MPDSAESWELIDEDGDLLGVINIVDALAILLVLAVVVAGVALVVGSDQPEETVTTATTNVTLELGPQPEYIVTAINEGDTYSPGSNTRLTITDVYVSPGQDQPRVTLRAQLQAPTAGDTISYNGAPPRLGRQLKITTARYQTSGRIRAVGGGNALASDRTTVVLRDTVSPAQARAIAPGDEVRVAGREVATIEDIAVFPTDTPNERTVVVEATLETYREGDSRQFGGTPLQGGQTIRLPTDAYTLSGQLERVGSGIEQTDVDVLVATTVDAETARRIEAGDVASTAGRETATVERVTVYGTANPDRKRVFVGLSLNAVTVGDQPQFGTQQLQRGAPISIETSGYTLSGEVERVNALEQRGTATDRTVTLRVTGIREAYAQAIDPGLTERAGNETIARISRVDVDPHPIITTGQNGSVNVVDHPFLRDVTLTADLQVRETTTGVRFKGEPIRQRSTVVLDLGTVTIEAHVVSVGI